MTGGLIVQVVHHADGYFAEVLDTGTFERTWRHLPDAGDVCRGDSIWWQSRTARLSRRGRFNDRAAGRCLPARNPLRK